MFDNKPLLSAGSLGLALACYSLAASAVDVPPVSGESVPFGVGESRSSLRLRDGKEVSVTGTRLRDNLLEVARSDGCVWTRKVEDIYGPSLTWKNCSPGNWGTGHIEDVFKKGQLWPLAVGNKVKYEYTAYNSQGKKNRKAFRECEVVGTEMVTAGGTDYPSYRVECTEHSGTRVFNYAPSVNTTVFSERVHKKRGREVEEYVRDL